MKYQTARMKNMVDMALGFTAMRRVFTRADPSEWIKGKIEKILSSLEKVRKKGQFEEMHKRFCLGFTKKIRLAKGGVRASYGQAAKVLDVMLKVCVEYCKLPEESTAGRIRPFLHAAIDTNILMHLRRKAKNCRGIAATTIRAIRAVHYKRLQDGVAEEIEADKKRTFQHPVEYDDVMWRKLNRQDE